MTTLLHDLRYALRLFLKQPAFTLSVVATLALGIGANTAIFSLIHSVLLRPLGYPEAHRLVRVWTHAPQQGREMEQAAISFPRFEAIRDAAGDVFEELGASGGGGFTLTGRGAPEQLNAGYVSPRLFQTLGLQPILGRAFLPEEDLPGGAKVVLVSYPFWQRHGSDPALVGQTLTLGGEPYGVVGVLPPQLAFPFDQAELFVPRVFDVPVVTPAQLRQGTGFLQLTARLKPGVSLARANEALRVIAARYGQTFPDRVDAHFGIKAIPFQEELVAEARPAFYALAGAVGCVLLIACVNVANLLLARLAHRRKEIAIRAALGAGRLRLAQQFLTESVLLTTVAGGVGVLLALWCVDAIRGLGPEFIPRAAEVRVSLATLGFTLAVSLVTGLVLGVVPALHAAGGNAGEALQAASSRGAVGGGVRQGRTRAGLLAGQVALSLVLLVGAGLLLNSLWRLQQVRMGFNPAGVLTAEVLVPRTRYPNPERQADFFQRLTERLDAVPGVRRSAAVLGLPLSDNGGTMFYAVIGRPIPAVKERPAARYVAVSPNYFATLEIPLVRGRTFHERDRADRPAVMVINETMARRLFPDGDAVGQQLLCSVSAPTVTEIVGVVGDVRAASLSEPAREEMYFPMFQRGSEFMTVLLRAEEPDRAGALAPALRTVVQTLDAEQPVARVRLMDAVVARSLADRRLTAGLLAGFAALALLLAAVGIYGVAAYGVAQRTREIGIRLAVGAQRGDVFGLIVGGGMKVILAGVLAGLAAAFGLTRLMGSLLYGVNAGDPATLAGGVLLLVGVALLANYLPARRAMRIDPVVALREE